MQVIILVNILYLSFISHPPGWEPKVRSSSIAFAIDLLGIPDLSEVSFSNIRFSFIWFHSICWFSFKLFYFFIYFFNQGPFKLYSFLLINVLCFIIVCSSFLTDFLFCIFKLCVGYLYYYIRHIAWCIFIRLVNTSSMFYVVFCCCLNLISSKLT